MVYSRDATNKIHMAVPSWPKAKRPQVTEIICFQLFMDLTLDYDMRQQAGTQ
jgi:hypothetical protein